MTRILGKLQLKKLVIRIPSGEDHRKVMCSITPVGTARLAQLDEVLKPVIKRAVRGFSRRKRETLLDSLGRIRLNEPAE